MEYLILGANFSIVLLTFVTVLLNWWGTVQKFKSQNNKIVEVKQVVEQVERATNGFLQATKDASMAAGLLQGTAAGFQAGHAEATVAGKIEAVRVAREKKE